MKKNQEAIKTCIFPVKACIDLLGIRDKDDNDPTENACC